MEDNKPSPKPSNIISDITPPKPSNSEAVQPAAVETPSTDFDEDNAEVTQETAPEVVEPSEEPQTEAPEEPESEPEPEEPQEPDEPEESAPEQPEEPTEPEEAPAEDPQADQDEPSPESDSITPEPVTSEEPAPEPEPASETKPESSEEPNGSTPPADPPAEPAVITTGQPRKKSHKLLFLIIILLLIAAGAGAYYWYTNRPSHKSSTAAVIIKKDIPNIRYVTTNEGWESFYPGYDNSSNYDESNIMIFEGLVRFENKTQIIPLLSTGWTNPDSSTWVFNLRPGVKFHSGRTMTAEDVKDSFDAAQSTDIGQEFASTIKSTTVTGPLQVTIKTDGPDPTLLKKLTSYYVYDTKSGKTDDPINGTGPFTIKPGTTAKPNSLELVAFDQYWGGRPHVRSFSFVGLDNDDSGKAYANNQANLMEFTSTPTALGTRPKATQQLDQSSVFVMPLNTLKAGSPLAKLQVRQAIEDALDPLAIAKVRDTSAVPATQLMPSSIPGYDPSITRPPTDVTKAKELLKEAGYPNGISFTLTYFAPSQATGVEIQKELAQAGITVNLDPQTEVKTLAAKAEGGGTDAYFNTFSSDIFDASDVLGNFDDTPNYTNPAVVKLLTQAGSTLDATKRLGYLQQASKLMTDDLGVIPVYVESADEIVYDPSFVIQRDIADNNLGIYFQNVYAK